MRAIITVAVAAAAAAANAQTITLGPSWHIEPIYSTVRVAESGLVDMVWTVTDDDGEWEQRFAVDGCAQGKGHIYLIDDDYTFISADATFEWRRGGKNDDIAMTMCAAGGLA